MLPFGIGKKLALTWGGSPLKALRVQGGLKSQILGNIHPDVPVPVFQTQDFPSHHRAASAEHSNITGASRS